jgi:hypothetical protein
VCRAPGNTGVICFMIDLHIQIVQFGPCSLSLPKLQAGRDPGNNTGLIYFMIDLHIRIVQFGPRYLSFPMIRPVFGHRFWEGKSRLTEHAQIALPPKYGAVIFFNMLA